MILGVFSFHKNENNILLMSSCQDLGIPRSTEESNTLFLEPDRFLPLSHSVPASHSESVSAFCSYLAVWASSYFTTWPGTCILVWGCLFCPSAKGYPSVHVCSWAFICLTVRTSVCLFPSLNFVSLCTSSELGPCQFISILSLSRVWYFTLQA